jgi:hypothetical protein
MISVSHASENTQYERLLKVLIVTNLRICARFLSDILVIVFGKFLPEIPKGIPNSSHINLP